MTASATVSLRSDTPGLFARISAILAPHCALRQDTGDSPDVLIIQQSDHQQLLGKLSEARAEHPTTKIILLTRWPATNRYAAFASLGILSIIGLDSPFFEESLIDAIAFKIDPNEVFSLPRCLQSDVRSMLIDFHTKTQFEPVLAHMVEFFASSAVGHDRLWEMRLTLEEMINNALYHGFKDRHHHDKYSPESFLGLYDDDAIQVTLAFDSRRWAVAVEDNAGTLDPEGFCRAIDRQISRAGVMDARGRGLYIMRRLSDRMMINVEPGRRTQVQLYFNRDLSPAWKTLEVNVANMNR